MWLLTRDVAPECVLAVDAVFDDSVIIGLTVSADVDAADVMTSRSVVLILVVSRDVCRISSTTSPVLAV